jgi:hypothetical protein
VAVLSHGTWQRRFGGDPAVVGAAIRLYGEPLTVVGVAPKDFLGRDVQVYVAKTGRRLLTSDEEEAEVEAAARRAEAAARRDAEERARDAGDRLSG